MRAVMCGYEMREKRGGRGGQGEKEGRGRDAARV